MRSAGSRGADESAEEGVALNTASSRGQPVIRADHLDLTFQTGDGPVHALSDVSLTIGKGDFVSFIGPSPV